MAKNRFSILIVEDDPNDQFFIRSALERHVPEGAIIHLAENGNEAITYLMGEKEYADRGRFPYPTIIVTDIKMPVADGFNLLQHRKANPQWASIPAIVLTSSADPDDVRTAYMLGASAYHLKPQTFDGLSALAGKLVAYWLACEIPEIEPSGRQVATDSEGKLGARYPQVLDAEQRRVKKKR